MKKSFIETKYFTVLLHVLVWSTFLVLQILSFQASINDRPPKPDGFVPEKLTARFIFSWSVMIILYYVNSLLYIPRFLFNKKIGRFVAALFLTLICVVILENIYNNLFDIGRKAALFRKGPPIAFFMSIFILALSTSIKVAQKWFEDQSKQKEMVHEKMNSELSLLKSQVNPHFLFNTLNGIYSLANNKSDKTAPAIVKLSQMMRYMLDESKQEFVTLSSELDYINTFIDLQKLRLFDNVKVDFTLDGEPNGIKIQPLLLIPFIENAFKHGTDASTECNININLDIKKDSLHLRVENDIIKSRREDEKSGFGLSNIKRRLQLEYPDRYVLTTSSEGGKFIVKLFISLR